MAVNVATGGNDIFYYGAYSSGDNTYNGLAGNDVFYDYGGNDTYVFNRGDGKDLLVDNDEYGSDANRILFGEGITPYDITFSVQNTKIQGYNVSNLVISLRNTNDSLTLLGWGQRTSFSNYIELSDGSVILDSGISIFRQGTSRNDVFTDIYNYNNTYIGGRGNDTYNDAAGNDTYLFSRGDGQDVIYEDYERGDEVNSIQLGDVESASDLMLYYEQMIYQNQLMHNLVIRIRNTTDKITVVGWDQRGGNSNYIQLSDGSRLTDASINSHISYYTLGSNVRNCIISSSSIGSADENINITGNALNNYIEGNYGNNIINGGTGIDTMAGVAGNDIYYADDSRDRIIEGVGGGTDSVFSSASYTLSSNVENLTLIGNVSINGTGNSLNNSIVGNAYANVIDGGAGADSMSGGYGNDKYVVDDMADVVTEAAGAGTDTVYSRISHSLATNVENLVLCGYSQIYGVGNALDNAIYGNAANNTLDGVSGADYLAGGNGNDLYMVDNVRDVVVEAASGGTDTVATIVSYSLGANVENLELLGLDPINATGNGLNNYILGTPAGNIINGGAGIDTMAGGAGNDSYYVDNAGDLVTEGADGGTDSVFSSASYTLSSNVENLTLIGNVSINGTGNALNNTIIGTSLNNVIDGGAGADSMSGCYGNDKYVVDDMADVVTEAAGAGTDTVYSRISHSLAVNVENLVLCGYSQIDGTGNALGNTIYGNTGNNVLDGKGGADSLLGGAGDDTYLFDLGSGLDVISDASGNDTISIGAGFSSNNTVFSRIARTNDLKISFSNSLNDSITVKDWFNSIKTSRIERIEFSNGGFLTDSDINLALQSMTAYRPGVIEAPINHSDESIDQQQLALVPVSQIV